MDAVHWERIERSAEFRELVARRRRFVLPATVFFLTWYFGFVVLCGYAPDFMGKSLYQGFTVGYGLALTQFVMVAVLGVAYLRYAARVLDPVRARLLQAYDLERVPQADEVAVGRPADDRFVRDRTGAPASPQRVPRGARQ